MAFNMPLPRLRHPIPVKIRKRLSDSTPMNPNTKEPVGKPRRGDEVSLNAQVSDKMNMVKASPAGKNIVYDGYLLFLQVDLETAGIEIEEGDKVVEIGTGGSQRLVGFYVENIQYRGHNPLKGGHTLVKAWLKDKRPVK